MSDLTVAFIYKVKYWEICSVFYLGCCPLLCCWSHLRSKCWSQWRHWRHCWPNLSSAAAAHTPESNRTRGITFIKHNSPLPHSNHDPVSCGSLVVTYLFIGGGEQRKEQVGERDRVNESLHSLYGCALGHDVQLCWRPVTGPALEDRKQLHSYLQHKNAPVV